MSPEVPIIILIIAIPTYFLSKWLLKKLKIGNESNRKYAAIIPTIILTPLIYLGIVIIWIFSISYYPKQDFNKEKWESNIEERYTMSKDIIESEMLIGKTKDEVIEILGAEYLTSNENNITYYLGFVPGFVSIDHDVLDIYFENGRVVLVSQHQT